MEEKQGFFAKLSNWIRNSVTFKITSIAILILLMLIPTSMVHDIIYERKARQDEAVNEISDKWGSQQVVNGPFITIPYLSKYVNDDQKLIVTKKYAHFLPKDLQVNGELLTELRYRGIYEAVLYTGKLDVKGFFTELNFKILGINEADIVWDEATLNVGITDMRGINEKIDLSWGNETLAFQPGVKTKNVVSSGISTPVKVVSDINSSEQIDFSFKLDLNGSKTLKFVPLGVETNVNLRSEWKHPSFTGNFLPDERKVDQDGFDASWRILQLNRDFPQQWTENSYSPGRSSFGLDLKVGVDNYQKNIRSQKYAVMIITLTFILFFFMEIINRKNIHPIQYLLVGFALSIFYLLLVSISEQSSFSTAYIISAIATIALILMYVMGVLKSKKLTAFLGGTLVLIYSFVYVILQLQDYALLMGSIGLFIVLAIIMYVTRNINWYDLRNGDN